MKRLHLILPMIVAVCLLAGPSTASARSYHGGSFNWGGVQNLFNNWSGNSNNYSYNNCFGQKDLNDYLKNCNKDWDKCDDDQSYFSFCKDNKVVYTVKSCDLTKYVCKDKYNWYGKLDCFSLCKKGSTKKWKFDCIKYNPCKPTPPDCNVVPTPAAAGAGLGLIGMLAMRRRERKIA